MRHNRLLLRPCCSPDSNNPSRPLMQDSLGGRSEAVMLACIAPTMAGYNNTYNALNFASKSRNIINEPLVKEVETKKAAEKPSSASARADAIRRAAWHARSTPAVPAATSATSTTSTKGRPQDAMAAIPSDNELLKRIAALEACCTELALQQTQVRPLSWSSVALRTGFGAQLLLEFLSRSPQNPLIHRRSS